MYQLSLPPATEAYREPSLRFRGDAANNSSNMTESLRPVLPLYCFHRTLVIADTRGIHHRGHAPPGTVRKTIRPASCNDGGLPDSVPFIGWLGLRGISIRNIVNCKCAWGGREYVVRNHRCCNRDELMAGYLSGTVQKILAVTVGGLEDLGFGVSYAAADDLATADLNPSCVCGGGRRLRGEETKHDNHKKRHRKILSSEGEKQAWDFGHSILTSRKATSTGEGLDRSDKGLEILHVSFTKTAMSTLCVW